MKVYWKYTGPEEQELAMFWLNPWLGGEEKIATFWWPAHPIEATAEAEKIFEQMAENFSKSETLRAQVAVLERGLEQIDQCLRIPAAEYVPAISDAWSIKDKTLKSARKLGET